MTGIDPTQVGIMLGALFFLWFLFYIVDWFSEWIMSEW